MPPHSPQPEASAKHTAAGPRGARPLRILTYSSLYPNAAQANHGVFVENRLRHLLASGAVESRVVAPVPWFPLKAAMFGHYAALAQVPAAERRHGIEVSHPRYPVIPKLGMTLAPWLMYAWTRRHVAEILRSGYDFDLIDAHYFYPDGIAAVMLGRAIGKPVTITARGTDINLIPRYPLARRMILWAGRHAAAMIAVCQALKTEMTSIGLDGARIRVLRNGVALSAFQPSDGAAARSDLGLKSPVLLSVGALIPRKGHDLVIQALPRIPGATLLIAGQGPEEARLRDLAARLELDARARFLGPVPHAELKTIYGAADVLVLASDREGWPNVLLEAMACGTPVAATDIWGNPEVVTEARAGRLIPTRTPEAIAETVRAILADPPARAATRAYAEGFDWQETTDGQIALFNEILSRTQTR